MVLSHMYYGTYLNIKGLSVHSLSLALGAGCFHSAPEDRMCSLCHLDETENEVHVLFYCL